MVGKAADAYVQRKERKESYLGNACYIDRIENFVKLTQRQFIKKSRPVRNITFERNNRIVEGHRIAVRYIATLTV